jgi:hypothetical protein
VGRLIDDDVGGRGRWDDVGGGGGGGDGGDDDD